MYLPKREIHRFICTRLRTNYPAGACFIIARVKVYEETCRRVYRGYRNSSIVPSGRYYESNATPRANFYCQLKRFSNSSATCSFKSSQKSFRIRPPSICAWVESTVTRNGNPHAHGSLQVRHIPAIVETGQDTRNHLARSSRK